MDVGPTFYWEFPYFGMATGLPVLFCKTVVPVLDSAVLIRPAGTGDSGLRLCGAHADQQFRKTIRNLKNVPRRWDGRGLG